MSSATSAGTAAWPEKGRPASLAPRTSRAAPADRRRGRRRGGAPAGRAAGRRGPRSRGEAAHRTIAGAARTPTTTARAGRAGACRRRPAGPGTGAPGPESAPVAEADEDDVADGGGDESRQQHGEQRRTHRKTALDQHHPADDRPAEQRRDRREGAGASRAPARALAHPDEQRHARRPPTRARSAAPPVRAPRRTTACPSRRVRSRARAPAGWRRRRFPRAAGGRRRRAAARARATTAAPATGSPITRYHGGDACPSESGRSSHSQPSSVVHEREEPAATSAAGTPISAPTRPGGGTRRR